MARRTVVICTDDLTGDEVPEDQVQDMTLRFGYDEWTLTLTEESAVKVREGFAHVVVNAPHKDHTPKWLREQLAVSAQPSTEPAEPTSVTVVPPDNKTVRRWWADLTPAHLRNLNLTPAKTNGRIPEDVMAAFVDAHAVASPQFSG